MPEYKELSPSDAAKILLSVERPVVVMHRRPDGDAVGSACALSLVFRMLGKDAPITSSDKIPERLKFIADYTKTEFVTDLSALTPITIDVASPPQLGSLSYVSQNAKLMIDHHSVGEHFADYFIISEASSAAEVLYSVVEELISMKKITMTEELAYALYAAISSDTGSFRYSNTSEKTHNIAALLLSYKIDTADINHRLFTSKSHSQLRAEGYAASNIKTDCNGKVAYITITRSDMDALSLVDEDIECVIDVVRSLSGVEVAFVVKELIDGTFRASLRSTGIDVASIASCFGGGGHIRASGCSPKSDSIEKASELILTEIKKVLA